MVESIQRNFAHVWTNWYI